MTTDGMRLRPFGTSGLRVSQLVLGTMMFGDGSDWAGRRTADRDEARAILDTYLEAGGNTIDTANRYTDGLSEQVVGELVEGRRDELVLSTKYTLSIDESDPNASGNHRKSLRRSLEQSLRRLRTDHVDILWVHIWDRLTPFDETMRALDDLVRSGKVLTIGVSDTPAWLVAAANAEARCRDRSTFSALQVPISAARRDAMREFLPLAEHDRLAVAAWSPLSGGMLTGRHADGEGLDELSEREVAVVTAVDDVAASNGLSSPQAALAWLMAQSPRIHPIVGATRAEHVADSLAAVDVELSDDDLDRITTAGALGTEFPYDMLEADMDAFVYGEAHRRVQPIEG